MRLVFIQNIPNNILDITGEVFYLEELAQCFEFQEYIKNCFVYNVSTNSRKILKDRYINISKETKKIYNNDIIFSDVSNLDLLITMVPNVLDLCKFVLVINTNKTYRALASFMANHHKNILNNRQKFYLLLEQKFETKSKDHMLFKNKFIYYMRGFYFENYKYDILQDEVSKELWFLSNKIEKDEYIKEDTMQSVERFCRLYNYTYTDERITYNPIQKYAGLFYIKSKNFMSRLPFEFWNHKKPVIFFDRSTSLLKKYEETELPLYLPVMKDNIPNTYVKRIITFLRNH